MKITVVGPGAMGCLFAALLTEAGHEVWLLDKSAERANRIAKSGIRVEGIGGMRTVRPNATSNSHTIGGADLVFIWVKAYDTESAAKAAVPALNERTRIISLQNGLGNMEAIARVVKPHHVIGGITSYGATLLDIGSTRHTGKGDTIIGGAQEQVDGDLQQVAGALSAAGIETKVSQNIESTVWSKLLINAAINPLTAITRLKNGQLLESRETRRLLDLVAEESEKIVGLAGIPLAYPDIRAQIEFVCRATSQNRSSMLQDILHGRRTEIDAINGSLVEKARALHTEAPANEMLVDLIKALEGRAGAFGQQDEANGGAARWDCREKE